MKIRELFEKWNLTGLKVKTPIMDMEWRSSDPDKDAAWDLYVELLTRITTQVLPEGDGVEQTALSSVYALFGITRQTLKEHGRGCVQFTKIAVIILNQVIRPFTAKWHRLGEQQAFEDPDQCRKFRAELAALQVQLRNYTKLLSDLASVEDLTEIEQEPEFIELYQTIEELSLMPHISREIFAAVKPLFDYYYREGGVKYDKDLHKKGIIASLERLPAINNELYPDRQLADLFMVETVLNTLKSTPDPEIRIAAINALVAMYRPGDEELLRKILEVVVNKDKNREVMKVAKSYLQSL